MTSHDDRVREQFRSQAATFSDTGFAARGLDWIIDTINPGGREMALDVACGAAHLDRALAPHVASVQGLDLVPEMLHQAQQLTAASDVPNLALLQGDATALPWIDNQFDLVGCRLTLHQVSDPAAVVNEMVRVAKPGGRVVVVDMIVDPTPAIADEANRLERLRDPSHGRTLTHTEILQLLQTAGAMIDTTSTRPQPLALEDWMARTQTPSETRQQVRQRLQDELDGGAATGLAPFVDDDGQILFVHTWLAAVAHKPTSGDQIEPANP